MIRWMIFLAGLVYLADTFVNAQEVPRIDDAPAVTHKMDNDMFDFVTKTLGGAKMAPHMKCTLKTHSSRELRKFSTGSQWVELLEVDFNSNGFESGQKMLFKIPSTATYGLQKTTNQWSGLGEDIKIDLGDSYGHWIRFSHDGTGRLIQLILGNDLRIAACQTN